MRSIDAGWLVVLCASSCGPGLDGVDGLLPPLFVVDGRVDWDEVRFLEAYAERWGVEDPITLEELGFALDELRVAFVWAGQPAHLEVCSRTSSPSVLDACVDPSWLRIGAVVAESAVDPETFEFEVAVDTLPEPRFTVGGTRSRVAFGSLVAFFGPQGAEIGEPDLEPDLEPPPRFQRGETIVGASFAVPPGSNQRVVYREGPWPQRSVFYPLPPTCDRPPRGVSIVTAGASACTIAPIADPLTVPVLGAGDAAHLECSAFDNHVIISASESLWHTEDERPGVCVDPDTYVVPSTGVCPYLEIHLLAGCYAAEVCERLEWDVRDEPPATWPCTEEST